MTRAALARAYDTFHALGLFDFAGDVSVVSPDRAELLIRMARVSEQSPITGRRTRTQAEDLLRVSLDNVVIDPDGRFPGDEAIIHSALYRARPDVRSVIHCHPKITNALGIAGQRLRPVSIRGLDLTAPGLPVYPSSSPIRTPEQAAQLVAILGQANACVMPAHGVVVVGESLEEACVRVVNLERSATTQFLATLVGAPQDLPAADTAYRLHASKNPGYIEGIWAYYVELAEGGIPPTSLLTLA